MNPRMRDLFVLISMAVLVGLAGINAVRAANLTITGCDTEVVIACKGPAQPPPVVVPPPVNNKIVCAGFDKTIVIEAPWAYGRYFTKQFGNFGANDALVLKVTPPANVPSFSIGFVEDGDGQNGYTAFRNVAVGETPCGTGGDRGTGFSLTYGTVIVPDTSARARKPPPQVRPGVPLYVTVTNRSAGQPSCGAALCNGFFTVNVPSL